MPRMVVSYSIRKLTQQTLDAKNEHRLAQIIFFCSMNST